MIQTKGSGQLERKTIIGTNLTGGAVSVGGVYALDTTQTNGGSTSADTDMQNIVATATANLRGFLVVALTAIAAGAVGEWLIKGRANVLVDGTTAVAPGDRLIPQNGSPNLVKQASTSLVNPCGLSFAAQTATSGTLTDVYFDGETWKGEKAAS